MHVWQLAESEAGLVLVRADAYQMPPGAGEVLVKVCAAGVTPTELIWYPTIHTKSGERRRHAVPGHEFSGVVAGVGEGVSNTLLGQEVYGMNDWFADGATAEYCITRPEWISRKPAGLTHVEAASVPIGALTAWQGLFERGKLARGEKVLVHGGSGAVGVYAVQLAKRSGAKVITTASARNEAFLKEIGVDEVIDYKTGRFEEKVRGADLVFDCVGGETLRRSWGVLGLNGRMVTIAADGEETKDERAKGAFFIVEPRGEELGMIGDLLEKGEIKAVVDAVVGFGEAGKAYAGEVKGRAGRGKVVVEVAG